MQNAQNLEHILNLSARILAPSSQKNGGFLHLGGKFLKSEPKCKTQCKGVKRVKSTHVLIFNMAVYIANVLISRLIILSRNEDFKLLMKVLYGNLRSRNATMIFFFVI